jgi:hypothetical protein
MFSDPEFLLLYVIYFLLFIGLVFGTIYAVEYKKWFRNNLIFFVLYSYYVSRKYEIWIIPYLFSWRLVFSGTSFSNFYRHIFMETFS